MMRKKLKNRLIQMLSISYIDKKKYTQNIRKNGKTSHGLVFNMNLRLRCFRSLHFIDEIMNFRRYPVNTFYILLLGTILFSRRFVPEKRAGHRCMHTVLCHVIAKSTVNEKVRIAVTYL